MEEERVVLLMASVPYFQAHGMADTPWLKDDFMVARRQRVNEGLRDQEQSRAFKGKPPVTTSSKLSDGSHSAVNSPAAKSWLSSVTSQEHRLQGPSLQYIRSQ